MVGQNNKCGVGIAFNAKIGGHLIDLIQNPLFFL